MENIKDYVLRQKQKLKEKIEALQHKPTLAIIQVGHVEASNRYVKNKIKDANEISLPVKLISCEEDISEEELLNIIKQLNDDSNITALICQLPLPKHISEQKVIEAIDPKKDADGFSPLNKYCSAATPSGIVTFLENQNFDFDGKNAVILGRSNIVGKPAHKLLLERHMNVIMLHTHTSESDKKFYLEHADLIIVATGKRHTLSDKYNLKQSAVIFDVGINFDENQKLCGDCDYDKLVDKVAYISKVPGGCGLLTRLQLLINTVKLYELNN